MPGVPKDMNGYRDFEVGHLRTSSYANGYDPHRPDYRSAVPLLRHTTGGASLFNQSAFYDDVHWSSRASRALSDIAHRDAGYGRSGRHNGIDPEFEQNSFDGGMRDGTEKSFEVDHLATYTSKSGEDLSVSRMGHLMRRGTLAAGQIRRVFGGTTHPEDGLMKLKQMESSTGIWTMRCLLIVESRHIIVIDKGNGDELERFPLSQVHEPTAVLKNDRRETYNNLILFTVIDDPRRKNSPSDMHIFQSVNAPAHDIVDEVLAAKGEGAGRRGPYDRSIPPPPSGPAPEPPYGKSSNYRETDKLAESHRYLGEPDLGESRRSERALWESRKDREHFRQDREEPNLGDSRLSTSNWGPPRLDDAQLGSSRLGESGFRDTGYRETRLGESRQDESRFGESRLKESGRDDLLLRESRLQESRRDDNHLSDTRLGKSHRDDIPPSGNHQGETRREDDWMSKSLRYRNTRVGEPRVGASDRFRDASQWIHQSYVNSPRYRRDDSPNSVRTMQALEYPGFSEYDRDFGWHTESRIFSPKKSGTNAFGTWSGRNFDPEYLETGNGVTGAKGKKGRKWYKFNFSKKSGQKSKGGSENRGYKSDSDYMSSTMPFIKAVDGDNYASLSRRRFKSETDVKADYQLSDDDLQGGQHGYGQSREVTRASYIHRDDMDTGQNEALERDVQLLNNCFDDIEKFVSRLQQAAEAYKELERRRYERGHRNKRKSAGDGMLTMRARPPPADDFIDIFQKFKFAFNLLAKLKAHIHDPNAPELVHFLFTPLSLIYEASRDPIHQGEDLSDRAVTPLLVFEAKQLLLNCLTSKELELWQRLGKSWTLTKEDYRGYVQPYTPRFYNGWQPSPQVIEEINRAGASGSAANRSFRQEEFSVRANAFPEPDPYPREDPYRRKEDPYRRDDPYTRSAREDPYSRSSRRDRDDFRPPSPAPGRFNESKRDSPPAPQPKTRAEENYAYSQELKRMGATMYEAVHERQGKNAKELTVEKGDIVQVLDRSRNWWKLKNYKGETGYAPYTILKEYQARDEYDNGQERRSGDYSSYINGNNQAPPPAPPPMLGSSRQGTRETGQTSPNVSPRSKSSSGSEKQFKADLHNELRQRINNHDDIYVPLGAPHSPRMPPKPTNISEHSTAEEVRAWLQAKGFSRRCMELLNGYHGIDLFDLDRKELERLLGRDEGKHLDSLLTVQKSNCGYRTRSTAELRYILQRRKERADHSGFPVDYAGKPPSFTPDNPPDYTYSSDDDDASSDSFGNAGKTLRNLLERQRKKIQKSQYQQYN